MPGDAGPTGGRPTALDVAIVLGLVALAAALRLWFFAGLGTPDDLVFRGEVNSIVQSSRVQPDNQAYRFSWWLPVVLSTRLLGVEALGLILPFTLASLVGIALVYLLALHLWGRPAAVLAALLVSFTPLDFGWSTLMTPDIILSVTSVATVLLFLRALDAEDATTRRRAWFLAAVTFWLGVHAKLSGLFIAPALALWLLVERRRLDREVWTLFTTGAALFGMSLIISYALWGDPLFAYNAELKFQGLTGTAETVRRVQPNEFWHFPRRLFLPDPHGDRLFGLLPWAVIALPLLALVARQTTATPMLVWGWLIVPLLALQLNVQYVDGVWATGFRNVRHLHPVVYPMAIIVAGAIAAIGRRWPAVAVAAAVVLLALGVRDSLAAAGRTQAAFAERREACRLLAALPPKPVWTDQALHVWCGLDPADRPEDMHTLHPNPEPRAQELAAVTEGYVVTGGAREPLYGCLHCIPSADDLPPDGFRLVEERDGPIAPSWRPEPLRIWEREPAPASAALPGGPAALPPGGGDVLPGDR